MYYLNDNDARKFNMVWAWFTSGERHRRPPIKNRIRAGSGTACTDYWRLWLQSPYQPEIGDFDVIVVSYDSSESETSTTITIDYDASSTDVAALLRDISDLGDGSDPANDKFTVTGGPLPLTSLQVSNNSTSGARIKSITASTHTLSRAWPLVDGFVF